ncbi:MAG: sulfotransferase [Nitrosopumilus sp.]|nr:sulfotransferase [Nitrosopumilus sp.]
MKIKKTTKDWKGIKTIHILGLPRTGTTILYQGLAKHSQLAYFYHKTFLPISLRKKINLRGFIPYEGAQWIKFHHELEYLEYATKIEKKYYHSVVEDFCSKFKTRYFLSKYPGNVLRIKWLDSIFPESKYIILERERKASIQSLYHFAKKHLKRDQQQQVKYEHGFGGWVTILKKFGDGSLSLDAITKYHDFMKNAQTADSKILKDKINVSYEQFTENPKKVLDSIYSFIGLSWDNSIKLPEIKNMNYRHEKKN